MENVQTEKKVPNSVKFAVKWWADRLDGTVRDLYPTEEEAKEFFFKGLELDEKNLEEDLKNLIIKMYRKKEEEFELLCIFPAQRKRFEELLTKQILEEIESQKVSLLMVGENGAEFALAVVAEKCEIDNGKNSIFTFAPCVHMFVDKNKVEVRYDEDERLITLFDEKEMTK